RVALFRRLVDRRDGRDARRGAAHGGARLDARARVPARATRMNAGIRAIERRWAELVPLFDAAVVLDTTARQRYVERIADVELRTALEALLQASTREGALDQDGGSYAARLIEPAAGLEGDLLGAWRVGPLIGSGDMASVFAATRADGAFEQKVAI